MHNFLTVVTRRFQAEIDFVCQPVHRDVNYQVRFPSLYFVILNQSRRRDDDIVGLSVVRNIRHKERACDEVENVFLYMKVEARDVLTGLREEVCLVPHGGADGDVLAVQPRAETEQNEGRALQAGAGLAAGCPEVFLRPLGLSSVIDGTEPHEVVRVTLQGPCHVPTSLVSEFMKYIIINILKIFNSLSSYHCVVRELSAAISLAAT